MFNNKNGDKPTQSHGKKDQLVGSVKESIGSVVSSDLQAKGAIQKAHGEAEEHVAAVMQNIEAHADHAKGSLKKTIGSVINNKELQAEGHKDLLKGEIKKN
jgi:uncharacterized protein YjbJ (UPF0337 family)